MNDLISRSALLEVLKKRLMADECADHGLDWKNATREMHKVLEIYGAAVKRIISNAPAVDAFPVTRCKDCAHYVLFEGDVAVKHCELFEQYDGECTDHNIAPDHFCSLGETEEEMQYRMEMEQYTWESMQSMCNPEDGSL